MLNPVQGIKTFEAKHPKATKVAKAGAAVAAASVVAAGVAYGKFSTNKLEGANVFAKLGEGYKILGSAAKNLASKGLDFVKTIPSTVQAFVAKHAAATEEGTETFVQETASKVDEILSEE